MIPTRQAAQQSSPRFLIQILMGTLSRELNLPSVNQTTTAEAAADLDQALGERAHKAMGHRGMELKVTVHKQAVVRRVHKEAAVPRALAAEVRREQVLTQEPEPQHRPAAAPQVVPVQVAHRHPVALPAQVEHKHQVVLRVQAVGVRRGLVLTQEPEPQHRPAAAPQVVPVQVAHRHPVALPAQVEHKHQVVLRVQAVGVRRGLVLTQEPEPQHRPAVAPQVVPVQVAHRHPAALPAQAGHRPAVVQVEQLLRVQAVEVRRGLVLTQELEPPHKQAVTPQEVPAAAVQVQAVVLARVEPRRQAAVPAQAGHKAIQVEQTNQYELAFCRFL